MPSGYGHFCPAARSLETLGDRWSLLIVRDLLSGPRRFSDLQRLLTNVTAKWLTIRLRQLESDGIVSRDERPGRREVWYDLTDKGRDLAPVVKALLVWGLKYERHPPAPDESVHPEHLVAGLMVALNEAAQGQSQPQTWRFEFDRPEASASLAFDGKSWALAGGERPADLVIKTTPRAWADFVTRPPARRRLPTRDILVSGAPGRVADFVATFDATSGPGQTDSRTSAGSSSGSSAGSSSSRARASK
jgi:DNA-binding HxlR family transcriptional regulator